MKPIIIKLWKRHNLVITYAANGIEKMQCMQSHLASTSQTLPFQTPHAPTLKRSGVSPLPQNTPLKGFHASYRIPYIAQHYRVVEYFFAVYPFPWSHTPLPCPYFLPSKTLNTCPTLVQT